ncbi:MAG TPA: hypothetical protein ENG83_08955 [Nitrospirae bacterium]|nr:hypothetical protein BMS3Abin06_01705 [bacterium BMS3Abin06]HDH12302.1 hypothetical protein [Nitrospirota bacterium]HDZ00809.1 hypothetical protein [Nitrospirota bacterium]
MRKEKEKNIYVWPGLAIMEFLTAIALTIILLVWALLINAPLLEIANPGISENPSRAPWYFIGLQELLVYFDPWIAGVMIPFIIIVCLMIIPYIDNNPAGRGEYTFSLRKFALINFNIGFLMWLILIFTGYFLRGPNWQFYWPWESWEAAKQVEENLWSLDPVYGLAGLAAYFGAGLAIPRLISPRFYRKCGFKRYVIVMTSMLLMYAVPIKIFLRLVFNIKYILVTPWFNI